MKTVCANPYMPGWEYVPDGEPHVFGGRLYVYGSHDRAGGKEYCEENYVCWSAPLDDLGNWRCEGESYRKEQEPLNAEGKMELFAPDVACGPDGRYYLYYAMKFYDICAAVSDVPQGPFEYYGTVHYPDGSKLTTGVPFDPAILCEAGGNYLYYGFCPPFHHPDMGEAVNEGSYMIELEDDMLTIKTEPVCVANGYETKEGTDYDAHPFFEASSIRHYKDLYYFIYSSLQGHELCYGTAKTPQGPFQYQGVLVSNGDIGYRGNEEPKSFFANNHGSIVEISGEYYIFYHRHTHGTHFSRQACAERLVMKEDGTFEQVEMTSSGLNGDSIPADRDYSAHIICNLLGPEGACKIPSKTEYPANAPYIFQEMDPNGEAGKNQFVKNLQKGSMCAVKYLDFDACSADTAKMKVRGAEAEVELCLDSPDKEPFLVIPVHASESWVEYSRKFEKITGKHAVWYRFQVRSDGAVDFSEFGFR